MSAVLVMCCVDSDFCDKLITHSEESNRGCVYLCVSNCVQPRNLKNEVALVRVGFLHYRKRSEFYPLSYGVPVQAGNIVGGALYHKL